MARTRIALALGAALMAVSCATGYGPNFLTGGYDDEKVDDTHYRVKFHGNGYASQERVWNFWIYRCAELTKQKGYTYFSLQKPGAAPEPAPAPAPEPAPAPAGPKPAAYYPDGGDAPRFIRTRGTSYVPIYVPGARITTWHTDAIVAMFKDPLPEDLVVLNAQTVLDELAPYVKSNGSATPVSREDLLRRAALVKRPASNYKFGGTL